MNPMHIDRAEDRDTAEQLAFRVSPHPTTGKDEIVFVSRTEAKAAVAQSQVFSTPSLEQDMLRWCITRLTETLTPQTSAHEFDPLAERPDDYDPLKSPE